MAKNGKLEVISKEFVRIRDRGTIIGLILVDNKGLPVVSSLSRAFDGEELAALGCDIQERCVAVSNELDIGSLKQVAFSLDKYLVSIRKIDPYLLVAISKRDVDLGVMNFEIQQLCNDISDILIERPHLLESKLKAFEKHILRLNKDLKKAYSIQKNLLPRTPLTLSGVDIAGMCFPAEQIGGDFYDFFSTKDGLNFLIGDVSGKGISAALLMAIVVPAFRTESDRNTLTPLVLNGVNRVVLDNIDRFSGVHVTAFFGSFDTNTKSIDFCNAGHIPPCVFRKSTRSFEWLEGQGYPLGIFDDINGKTGQVPIEKGDILFLFTDGFLEAKNMEGKVFSKDHLLDLILKYSEYDAQSILEKLFEEVLLFLNNSIQKDDATLAVLKF